MINARFISVLKMSHLADILHAFVSDHSTHFDEAHDINHITKVVSNAKQIYNNTKEEDRHGVNFDLILVCCYLHDIRDHKMVDHELTITETRLREFITSIGYNPDLILLITDLISFSKEAYLEKNGYPTIISTLEQESSNFDMTPEQLVFTRNVVSDADKIEALGETGIERCKAYGEYIGIPSISRIVRHCEEKLLLLRDHYIHTRIGKELASPGHDYIVEWYESHKDE